MDPRPLPMSSWAPTSQPTRLWLQPLRGCLWVVRMLESGQRSRPSNLGFRYNLNGLKGLELKKMHRPRSPLPPSVRVRTLRPKDQRACQGQPSRMGLGQDMNHPPTHPVRTTNWVMFAHQAPTDFWEAWHHVCWPTRKSVLEFMYLFLLKTYCVGSMVTGNGWEKVNALSLPRK